MTLQEVKGFFQKIFNFQTYLYRDIFSCNSDFSYTLKLLLIVKHPSDPRFVYKIRFYMI